MNAAASEACRRCGGPNFIWFAPSPLWNLVMRENDINGRIQFADLVCAGCFMQIAAELGVAGKWRLTIDPEPDELIYTTPSGRVWNPETWLWEESA